MKGDTTQPTRISADEYERFKQFVEDVHGSTRGHLKTEIESTANPIIRQNRYSESRTI